MVRKAALICLALAGCGDVPRPRSETEIKQLATDAMKLEIQFLRERLERTEARLGQLEGEAKLASIKADIVGEQHDSLVKTFNSNVRKDNEDAVSDMTRRGACGREWLQDDNGNYFQTNKACTLADLKK